MRNVSIDLECFNNNLPSEKLETETRQEISQRRTPKQMEAHVNVLGVRPVLNTKSWIDWDQSPMPYPQNFQILLHSQDF